MIKQRTVRSSVIIEGVGLQTGSRTRLVLKSAPADSGINFIRVDLPGSPVISLKSLSFENCNQKARRTTLKAGNAQIQTTEHLLSALFSLGINNILIEADSVELPGLDGSALEYVEAIKRAGIFEQDIPAKELVVKDTVRCTNKNGASIEAVPYDGFKISYSLSYPVKSIGEQFLSLDITEKSFIKEIAPARTFCMKREAILLRLLGFGKGADYKNTLIMGKDGPVKNKLRFPDEPVRHKILDLIGDLCLVGINLKTHIIAIKSGHTLNMELVKKLKKE